MPNATASLLGLRRIESGRVNNRPPAEKKLIHPTSDVNENVALDAETPGPRSVPLYTPGIDKGAKGKCFERVF